MVIRCQHCTHVTALAEAGARSVGWRMFQGKSITGKDLWDVLCPVCSGRGTDPGLRTWDVRCLRCNWWFTDTWSLASEPVLTAAEALDIVLNHSPEECVTDHGYAPEEFQYRHPVSGLWINFTDVRLQEELEATRRKA